VSDDSLGDGDVGKLSCLSGFVAERLATAGLLQRLPRRALRRLPRRALLRGAGCARRAVLHPRRVERRAPAALVVLRQL